MDLPPDSRLHARADLSNHTFQFVGAAALLLGTPFGLYNILYTQPSVGVVTLIIVSLFVLEAASLRWRHKSAISHAVLLAIGGVGICYAAHQIGTMAFYWAFPLIVLFHFLLGRVAAATLNLLFLAAIVFIAAQHLVWLDTARILVTAVLTSSFAWIFATLVQRQHSALEGQVITDALTGAYNRRYFSVSLAKLMEQKQRYGHPASLVFFDIDHFKALNDSYGHGAGDRMLRILADTVKARLRVVDELFRYGGEEFVILLPDTRIEQAATLAQNVTDMIADIRVINSDPVTISCGVGEVEDDESARDWLQRCDEALYEAKRSGRGRVCLARSGDADDRDIAERRPTQGISASNGG